MTYGHSATETLVAMVQGEARDTGLDLHKLEEISSYFRDVRKKYHQFASEFAGVDTRVQVYQVPGGMISNLYTQLRDQGALERMNEVLDGPVQELLDDTAVLVKKLQAHDEAESELLTEALLTDIGESG